VALHNYVNKIIRDTVPQKNLLGNVEITVIRVFFYIYHKFILTPAIFLGDEMLEIGHWKNTDFHPFSTRKSCQKRSVICLWHQQKDVSAGKP
jgi:hypothetical protein